MQRIVGILAVAAAIVLSSPIVVADDNQNGWTRVPMGPGYGAGPGYGMMGPGYGMGPGNGMMGPGYTMGPSYQMGYGMGQGFGMGSGGMRGYAGRPPIDPDHDGVVSNTEAARHFEEAFTAMDGDGDGKLSLEEFSTVFFGPGPHMAWRGGGMQPWQERKEARFKEMDTNTDGNVTQEEFLAYGKKRFEDSDRNKDAKVTVWEFMSQRHF